MLEFLWTVEIRPSSHNILTANMDEKDRPSDVALLNGKKLKFSEELIATTIYILRWTVGSFG